MWVLDWSVDASRSKGVHEFIPRTGYIGIWIHPGPAEFDSCLVWRAMPVLRGVTLGWHPFVKQRGAGSIFIRFPCHLYRQFRIGVWFPVGTSYRGLRNLCARFNGVEIRVVTLQENMMSTPPACAFNVRKNVGILCCTLAGHIIYESCETALELVWLYCFWF